MHQLYYIAIRNTENILYFYFHLQRSERYSDNLVNFVCIPCQLLAARTDNIVESAEKKKQAFDFFLSLFYLGVNILYKTEI